MPASVVAQAAMKGHCEVLRLLRDFGAVPRLNGHKRVVRWSSLDLHSVLPQGEKCDDLKIQSLKTLLKESWNPSSWGKLDATTHILAAGIGLRCWPQNCEKSAQVTAIAGQSPGHHVLNGMFFCWLPQFWTYDHHSSQMFSNTNHSLDITIQFLE